MVDRLPASGRAEGPSVASEPVLRVEQVTKRFQSLEAVRGVSFSVNEGDCLGLLGPNGAGKTTTVEMLEGISTPTSGRIEYRGGPLDGRYRQAAGIQFQSTALQDFLTAREHLALFASFYRHSLPIDDLVELCALGEFVNRDARKLSGGQRQRLLLAIALVNDPDVLFLDEPTTGLDPQARRNFWSLIRGVKGRGKSIVLTTHYMEEAYLLCDEIAIMDHGRIIAQGTPDALLAQHFRDVVLELPRDDFPVGAAPSRWTLLETERSIEILTDDVNGAINWLLGAGATLARLQIRPRNLEDLFLELTGRELRQ
jgi:ABC-2 type transport system ATP-binding protein